MTILVATKWLHLHSFSYKLSGASNHIGSNGWSFRMPLLQVHRVSVCPVGHQFVEVLSIFDSVWRKFVRLAQSFFDVHAIAFGTGTYLHKIVYISNFVKKIMPLTNKQLKLIAPSKAINLLPLLRTKIYVWDKFACYIYLYCNYSLVQVVGRHSWTEHRSLGASDPTLLRIKGYKLP